MDNAAVLDTNDYASSCKKSAVALGYWQDDYLPLFVKENHKKPALANNCFYTRFKSVNAMVWKFLNRVEKSNAQIVNLGAGYETLFWRLKDQNVELAKFVEVDFPPVTSKKCSVIEKNKQLLDKLCEPGQDVSIGATDLHAKTYHLVAADLSDLVELENKLSRTGIKFSAPTLFIAEFVLGFLKKEHIDLLLTWIAAKFTSAFFLSYNLCNVDNPYGSLLVGGFHGSGCRFSGYEYCKTLETHRSAFLRNNWHGSKAWLAAELYDLFPSYEKRRINNIELLDERSMYTVLNHYCMCTGWIGKEYEEIDCKEPL